MEKPLETAIRTKLTAAFSPTRLDVRNDSARHAGHLPSEEESGETHFTVILTSAAFTGMTRIERHRAVNRALALELAGGVHALVVKAFGPEDIGA